MRGVDYVKAGKAGAFGLGVSFLDSVWMPSALAIDHII